MIEKDLMIGEESEKEVLEEYIWENMTDWSEEKKEYVLEKAVLIVEKSLKEFLEGTIKETINEFLGKTESEAVFWAGEEWNIKNKE